MTRLNDAIRDHWRFLLLISVLLVVMTFPTIEYVFNTEVSWLPTENRDVWLRFWDTWYGKQMLRGQAEFFFTDKLFYPHGLSLDFHMYCIPHMILFGALQLVMPPSNAYCMVYLLIVFTVSLSAYIYILYIINDRWVSTLGAVIFGLSPFVVGHAQHPEINFIATIPLSLYCFHRGTVEHKMALILERAAFLVSVGSFRFIDWFH